MKRGLLAWLAYEPLLKEGGCLRGQGPVSAEGELVKIYFVSLRKRGLL